MNDYVEVRLTVSPCADYITDVLAQMLADVGFESFLPDADGLAAFISSKAYAPAAVLQVVANQPFDCTITTEVKQIEGTDWNAEWERNYFKPLVIGAQVVIHSTFHTDVPKAPYDIVIDPKMAFGTGHHATTSLVVEQLLGLPVAGAKVIDMGTGTGILAILASMRGARQVVAVELDEAAYVNAQENVCLNDATVVELIHGDASALEPLHGFDLLLANINRNVILADIPRYAATLRHGGVMVLSGFYLDDIEMLTLAAQQQGFEVSGVTERQRWACLRLTKE